MVEISFLKAIFPAICHNERRITTFLRFFSVGEVLFIFSTYLKGKKSAEFEEKKPSET